MINSPEACQGWKVAKYLGRTDTRTRPVDVVGSKSAVKPIHFGPGVGSNKQLIAAERTS